MQQIVSETVVVSQCLSMLRTMGIKAWRNNSGALYDKHNRLIRYGLKGSSDIIGLLPDGRFLAIECKSAKGKLRPEQIIFLTEVKANNGVGMCVRSVEEMIENLYKAGGIRKEEE